MIIVIVCVCVFHFQPDTLLCSTRLELGATFDSIKLFPLLSLSLSLLILPLSLLLHASLFLPLFAFSLFSPPPSHLLSLSSSLLPLTPSLHLSQTRYNNLTVLSLSDNTQGAGRRRRSRVSLSFSSAICLAVHTDH